MRAFRRHTQIAIATAAVLASGLVPLAAQAAPAGIQAGTLTGIALDPDTVVAGTTAQGTITLAAPSVGTTVISLTSTNPGVVSVPPSVTVPDGVATFVFPVPTIAFSGPGDFGCVFARAGGVEVVDCINVNPVPTGPTLQSLTFSPTSVVGGAPATGTVRFATVTDGAVVTLVSSNPTVVSVPAETWVNGGASTGAFPVTTTAVTTSTSVTVSATSIGVTRTASITVTPGTPPPADTVRITRAEWNRGMLRINATSTNHNAILSVYLTVSDSFMFTLNNLGGGRYEMRRSWLDNPRRITVKSNFGGSATANL